MSRANPNDRATRDVLLFLNEDRDDAAVALFTRLCRQSPKLRAWLWNEFAKSAKTRTEFARVLAQAGSAADESALAHSAGEDQALALEKARLLRHTNAATGHAHGGLSRAEIERWIRFYQAGSVHPGAHVLLQAWRKRAREQQPADAALLRASGAFLAEALGQGRTVLLRRLVKAAGFLSVRGAVGRAAYGHAHRWKVQLLLYVLNHPQRDYRTGELCAHLARQRMRVDGKAVRRFCERHGIARNKRAGRPRRLS